MARQDLVEVQFSKCVERFSPLVHMSISHKRNARQQEVSRTKDPLVGKVDDDITSRVASAKE